jgi:DNA-binding transcriptional regulator YhcF (GntR family)
LKVTLAELERNKIVNQSRQKYIMITEDSADVSSITKACEEEFDDETLVIVSSNGLSIEDSEATRGTDVF